MRAIARSLFLIAAISAAPILAAASPAAESLLVAQSLRAEGDLPGALAELDRALDAAPEEPYLHLERARLLFDIGRLDEASVGVARARAAAPDEIEALRLQGRIELARAAEDPAAIGRALESFTELRRRDASDVEVLVALGQLHLASGQAELAAEALNEALRLRPGNTWIESLRSRAVQALDDGAAARLQGEALDRDPSNLAARLELSERLSRAGRHAEAVALLEAVPASQRERPEVRERLARQLHFAGETERALPIAESLFAERPDSPSVRRVLSRIYLALGRFEEAESTLAPIAGDALVDEHTAELLMRAYEARGEMERAAELLAGRRDRFSRDGRPRLAVAAQLDLARLYMRNGRFDLASQVAAEVAGSGDEELAPEAVELQSHALVAAGLGDEALEVAKSPGAPETLRLEMLLRLGREQEAVAAGKALLASSPEAKLRVAAVYHDLERWAEAATLLEEVLVAQPDSIEAAFRLAACSERLGRIERAVELFRSVLERAPQFAAALNYLGYLWIERAENLDEALRLVSEAVRLDPDSGAYVDSLGWGLYQLGRYEEAVKALERASRLLPGDATIHEHLGDARLAKGDRAGATESYRRAAELAPDSAGLARKLAELAGES